mgnify:CR=1 FL=1
MPGLDSMRVCGTAAAAATTTAAAATAATATGAAAAAAEEDDEDCDEGRAATTKSSRRESPGYSSPGYRPLRQHEAQNSATSCARAAPGPAGRPRQAGAIFTANLMEPAGWHRCPLAADSKQPAWHRKGYAARSPLRGICASTCTMLSCPFSPRRRQKPRAFRSGTAPCSFWTRRSR